MSAMPRYVMTVRCADGPGIVHTFTAALLEAHGNILDNAQYGDPLTEQFCMRTRFESPITDVAEVRRILQPAVHTFGATFTVRDEDAHQRVLIMVSKFDHCLLDLLYRWQAGELPIEIPLVVSNHPDCAELCARYGVPYLHLPVTKDTKVQQEAVLRGLIAEHGIDFVVLARYMQVLSEQFCADFAGRIINIHHSFLPGFKGARPYQQAYERGVKMIGATAHLVTADLDEGPIIEQGVVTVDHSMDATTLSIMGRDVERQVLSRAVRQQAEDRLFLIGHRVVVFH
ncbi:MAG: formyltetrahydrofolate deformylase [Actinomycetota bacterium]|nr:formyltetrahydrofolate deformylase [Actinomycetota bacterium]